MPFHVNKWLSIAVARNVQELFIHVSTSSLQIQVLRSMFSCEGLRSLELDCKICISPEIVVSLPRLESLKLISIYFQSKEDFCKLLGGCPVLKDLYIDMDIGEMVKYLHLDIDDGVVFEYVVSSTSLRRLVIYAHDDDWELVGTLLCSVHFDAPSLEYVKLDDHISSIFIQQKSLTSLVEANIQLVYLDSVCDEENYCNAIAEAICSFDSAQSLTLSTQVTQAISCATIKMRTRFNKLTRLEVKIDADHSLQDFIELSDNLEVLTIGKGYDSSAIHHTNSSNWRKPSLIPGCLSNSLRTVLMVSYDGYPDEFAMIGYILQHGRVLKVLEIYFGSYIDEDKTQFEEIQKIIKFPRKSPICVVEFDG